MCLGVPPMRYWTQWRMSVASQWLRDDQLSVDEAAEQLGYGSRAAFARTFKATTGHSPGEVRRSARASLRTINEQLALNQALN